jgi:hypothetical protein
MKAAQVEFKLSGGEPTQGQKILELLRANRGEWVSMFALYQKSGAMAVHSRISDLRSLGNRILNKTEVQDGVRFSFYKLEESL